MWVVNHQCCPSQARCMVRLSATTPLRSARAPAACYWSQTLPLDTSLSRCLHRPCHSLFSVGPRSRHHTSTASVGDNELGLEPCNCSIGSFCTAITAYHNGLHACLPACLSVFVGRMLVPGTKLVEQECLQLPWPHR